MRHIQAITGGHAAALERQHGEDILLAVDVNAALGLGHPPL